MDLEPPHSALTHKPIQRLQHIIKEEKLSPDILQYQFELMGVVFRDLQRQVGLVVMPD